MYSSLVVIGRSAANVKEEDYTKLAEQAGVKFLKIGHIAGISDLDYSIGGFQCVHIAINKNYQTGRTTYTSQPSRDRDGNDCDGLRNLVFRPNRETGELEAYLPDTPFNRRILSATYGRPGCDWVMTPANVPEDIIKQIIGNAAVDMKREEDEKKTATVIERLSAENVEKTKLLAEMKKKIEDMENQKIIQQQFNLNSKVKEDTPKASKFTIDEVKK